MTLEQIIHDLRTFPGLPVDAVRAGMGRAEGLASAALEVVDKLRRGVYPTPGDLQFLLYAEYILAAARETSAFSILIDHPMSQEPVGDAARERRISARIVSLCLGSYDGDEDSLFAALESPDTHVYGRAALFRTLARLTWEGRIAKAKTTAFLRRFYEEKLQDDDDPAWRGWADAIALLGLEELAPLLREALGKESLSDWSESDVEALFATLEAAARDYESEARFIEAGHVTFDDPVAALSWLDEPEETEASEDDDDWGEGDFEDDEDDPAAGFRLALHERQWIFGFLLSPHVPEQTMSWEMVDGFFTAIAVGPAPLPPTQYVQKIWDPEGRASPDFDSEEQAKLVLRLLVHHMLTIESLLAADLPPEPEILGDPDDEDCGQEWAAGFLMGMQEKAESWSKAFDDEKCATVIKSIIALSLDKGDDGSDDEPLPPELRKALLAGLPMMVREFYDFWRRPGARPARSDKVGRNEPCPCGSGKKYKRCCGAS